MLFDDYMDESEPVIHLLRSRLNKRTPGHKMTELEAWQYVSWGQFKVLQQLGESSPAVGEALHALQRLMAQECATQYVGRMTGVYPPPVNQTGFKNPAELEALKAQWTKSGDVSTETAPSDEGWTPSRGYL